MSVDARRIGELEHEVGMCGGDCKRCRRERWSAMWDSAEQAAIADNCRDCSYGDMCPRHQPKETT